MSKIELRQVNKRYSGAQVLTINKADLTIDDGEFCVFVGPSGCGKSTLLRMVAGLEEITSGDVLIAGERVNNLPPAKRGVAMVFQSYALYPHMTVRENMAFGLQVFGADKAQIDTKVREAAELLQLTHLLERLPKQLSGGQRQRVAIGRAIVKEPRVFLFDEPLSNLDAALRVQTRLEIARLHKRIGKSSMIYVTHDQVEAMTLADKIVLLHAGERIQSHGSVAQVGTPLQLYHRPASMFVGEFIGSPKMNVLPGKLVQANPTQASVQVGSSTISAMVNAHHLPPQSSVSVGVRPEDIRVTTEGAGDNRLSGGVSHVEKLGDCSMLYMDLGQGLPMLTVSVDGTATVRAGDRINLQLAPDSLHLFDADGLACHRTVDLPN